MSFFNNLQTRWHRANRRGDLTAAALALTPAILLFALFKQHIERFVQESRVAFDENPVGSRIVFEESVGIELLVEPVEPGTTDDFPRRVQASYSHRQVLSLTVFIRHLDEQARRPQQDDLDI